jgi:hypothetical protein
VNRSVPLIKSRRTLTAVDLGEVRFDIPQRSSPCVPRRVDRHRPCSVINVFGVLPLLAFPAAPVAHTQGGRSARPPSRAQPAASSTAKAADPARRSKSIRLTSAGTRALRLHLRSCVDVDLLSSHAYTVSRTPKSCRLPMCL